MSPDTHWLPDVDAPRRKSQRQIARTTESQRTAAAVIAGRLRCDPQTARKVADPLPPIPMGDTPAGVAMRLSLDELRTLAAHGTPSDPQEPR